MLGEFLLRATLGGTLVCVFALLAELFQPKTFSGIFGAAPSVAIASLALTYRSHEGPSVEIQGRGMLLGAAAMFVYGAVCVAAIRRRGLPVWVSAVAAWGAWFAVALCAWRIGVETELLP